MLFKKPAPLWIDPRGWLFPIMREAQGRRFGGRTVLRVRGASQPHARRRQFGFASAAIVSHAAPMRIVIAAVGRLKQGPERDLAASYRKRAEATGRALGLRAIEVIEIRQSRAQDVERRRVEESIAIANIIPEGAVVVVLDGRGENLDSGALAGLLREWRAEDRAAVCFIVGGADGLAPSLIERAQLKLAFGRVTWPHQLARIMLLEQIYRAATMLSGHPYHRV
jgi:23S rRNA (pseudouridine1915-N3)-methyltransferase